MKGDANGAPHPDPKAYAKKFSGKYAHRLVTGGIGHNLPQEAPQAFADAIIEVAEDWDFAVGAGDPPVAGRFRVPGTEP